MTDDLSGTRERVQQDSKAKTMMRDLGEIARENDRRANAWQARAEATEAENTRLRNVVEVWKEAYAGTDHAHEQRAWQHERDSMVEDKEARAAENARLRAALETSERELNLARLRHADFVAGAVYFSCGDDICRALIEMLTARGWKDFGCRFCVGDGLASNPEFVCLRHELEQIIERVNAALAPPPGEQEPT